MSAPTTPTMTGIAQAMMTVDQARHLVRALEHAIIAARRDAAEYDDVAAMVCVTLKDDTAHGARVEIESLESWITAFDLDAVDIDGR